MKTTSSPLQRRARVGAHIAGAASFLLIASLGSISAKGKPVKPPGDDEPELPAEATVAYEVTLLGFGGDWTAISDVNSAGIAVGKANDVDGTNWSFVASSDGMETTAEYFASRGWQMPEGWGFSSRTPRINEANSYCGLIYREVPFQYALVLIDLDEVPGETIPIVPEVTFEEDNRSVYVVDQNEHNDVLMEVGGQPYLYRQGELVPLVGAENLYAVALNDALEVSLQGYDPGSISGLDDSAYRYTLETPPLIEPLEDLSERLRRSSGSWVNDITNDGMVFGRSGSWGKWKAGSVARGSVSWIDGALPKDSTAARANESGQVLGGYNISDSALAPQYNFGTDLWISHPVDGLFAINDLVTGAGGDAETFISWEKFARLAFSEPSGATGYGIIAGMARRGVASGENWEAFILTPRLKE